MASAECMGESRASTPVALAVQFTVNVYERNAGGKSNTTLNHDTECRTSVAMRNAEVHQPLITVSPNSIPTIVMLQAESEFVSKHNVAPFRCPCSPFMASLAA
ncbi:hypothetical protein TNCV_2468581 [Trichonephila clavipes]|nr:hypothetical protein TNCV_2468581 [Trichonephila clavipes]